MNFKVIARSRGEKGFSLTEMMIALGIGAITISAIIGGLSMSLDQRKLADQKTETGMLLDQLISSTGRASSCQATVAVNGNHVDTGGADMPITIGNMSEGMTMSSGAKISMLRLSCPGCGSGGPNVLQSDSAGNTMYSAMVKFKTSTTLNGTVHESKMKTMPLLVEANSSGVIIDCQIGETAAMLCTKRGGNYDVNRTPACIPVGTCLYGGAYSEGVSPAQGGFNNPTTGGQSCPKDFTRQRSGTISVAQGISKYSAATVSHPIYTCTICATDPGSTTTAVPAQAAYTDINSDAANAVSYQTGQYNSLLQLIKQSGRNISLPW